MGIMVRTPPCLQHATIADWGLQPLLDGMHPDGMHVGGIRVGGIQEQMEFRRQQYKPDAAMDPTVHLTSDLCSSDMCCAV